MAVSVLKTCDPSVRRGDYCHPPAHSLHHRLQPPVVKQKNTVGTKKWDLFEKNTLAPSTSKEEFIRFFLQQTWVMFMPWFPTCIFELNHDLGREFVVGGWEPTCTCGFGGIFAASKNLATNGFPNVAGHLRAQKNCALFAGRGNDRKWLKHLMTWHFNTFQLSQTDAKSCSKSSLGYQNSFYGNLSPNLENPEKKILVPISWLSFKSLVTSTLFSKSAR